MSNDWTLPKAIRFILNQHNEGIKLDDLIEELENFKDDLEYKNWSLTSIIDDIETMEDVDYLIYGTHRFFIYTVGG